MQFFLLLILSAVLMFSDHRLHCFTKVKAAFSVVVLPLQYFVDAPIRFVNKAGEYFASKHRLLHENSKLQTKQLLLLARIHRLITLQKENSQLRALLSSAAKLSGKVHVAQLLALNLNQFDPQVVLDKGRTHNVYIGQPVLDAYGVMGEVVAVGPITSRILLVTSTRSAVPIEDTRSGVRAIAVGDGATGMLKLVQVPDTTDIKPGDLLVTSGFGLRYPVGYPVGTVNSVKHIVGKRFASIKITPSAKISSSREVLLVWPQRATFAQKVRKLLVES